MEKFKNQSDYSSFLAWKYEGSCIAQRMATSAPGGRFDIPEHWHHFKSLERDWPLELPGVLTANKPILSEVQNRIDRYKKLVANKN